MVKFPRAESVLAEALVPDTPGEEYRAFGVAADTFDRYLAMLELRLRTGTRLLFAYHTLGRAEWNPSRGITLRFPDATVVVLGRNLGDLFAAVREQKAAWVAEADRVAAELSPPSAAVVESIEVELLGPLAL